jgi:hypothetical protein
VTTWRAKQLTKQLATVVGEANVWNIVGVVAEEMDGDVDNVVDDIADDTAVEVVGGVEGEWLLSCCWRSGKSRW